MSYTPTAWQDYPGSTSTPITAARLNNMESGISSSDTRLTRSENSIEGLRSALTTIIPSLHPDWTEIHAFEVADAGAATLSGLLSSPPVVTVSDVSGFVPGTDGAFLYSHKGGSYIYFHPSRYTITAAANSVTITFGAEEEFEDGERLEIYLYLKSGGSSGRVWRGIGAIGLTTTSEVVAENITINGTGTIENFGTKWPTNAYVDSWYDCSAAAAVTNKVSIYSGGQLPPAIYIPSGCAVFQGETVLPSGFYVVLGNDNLMVTTDSSTSTCRGFAYYVDTNSRTNFNYCLISASAETTSEGKKCGLRKAFYEGYGIDTLSFWRSGVKNGVTSCYTTGDELVDLVIDMAEYTLLPK